MKRYLMLMLACFTLSSCSEFDTMPLSDENQGIEPGIYDITWETDPDDLPFSLGVVGTQYTVRLPAGGSTTSTIWGEDIYSDDSSIGKSAVHAGLISFASGGTVTFEICPGQASYIGSTRNGVTSVTWGVWPRSFIFK
jgi:LCCL domain